MAHRKERTLKGLYNVTDSIMEPEITPVLKGSCRMQGPIDETDYDIQADMVSSWGEKGFGRCSKSQKVDVREESGTCNVCSAPCSSCLHINRALMGSTDESCRGNAFSQCSVNDFVTPVKSSACDNDQHTASEASNLFCVNSSHDYFSENAESKASLRTSDVSAASEDVEMLPKLSASVAVAGDQGPIDPEYVSDQRTIASRFEDPKGLEGDDDNSSCVSGVNTANKLASYNNGVTDRKSIPCSSASANSLVLEVNKKTPHFQTEICSLDNNFVGEGSHNSLRMQTRFNEDCTQKLPSSAILLTELSSPKLDLIGIPSSADMDDGASSLKVQSTCPHPPSGESLYHIPNVKDFREDSCSYPQGESPQCPKECLSPLLFIKEEAWEVVCGQKSASDGYDDIQNTKFSHIEGNSEVAERISSNLEAETSIASGDPPAESLNLSEQIDEVEKFKQSPVSPDTLETTLLSQPMDDSDESDMVEHDVKVCDICGDAGREDLLAICSRCSDGAEHTYCMSYMLDKVPEGEWMCEECKFDKEIKNPKQNKFAVDGNEKNQSSGQAITVNTNIFVKLDTKDSDVEGTRANKDISSAKASGKRHADSREVGSAPKRQALEPMTGSPRASNLSRLASLSRDCSSKNLDKGKVKPGHQSSSGTYSISDMQETAGARLQTPRGSLVKSDSFNSSNGKPKVKLVDEVVLQKQKSAREHVSLDTKEGVVRLMGRSMSFRSTNSGRLNTSESKVKMISPKSSHVQDLKVLKEAKDQNVFERKNSFRSEPLWVNSTAVSSPISTTRVDQKPVCRGETYSLSSVGNSRESKAVQSDSKSSSLPKATNRVARRGSEMPWPLGEIKRQSRVVGASFNNGTSSFAEQKPNQISPKDNHLPNTCETPFCNVNESLPEGFPRLRESTNPVEIMKDNSVNDSRQNVTASGRGIPCHKCKEIGHAAQFCTFDRNRSLVIDASAVRSSKEVINGGNRLKAAIEAAMLKKPGIYRKNRALDRPDELSTSSANLNCGVDSQDQLSNSNKAKNIFTADEVNEGQEIPRNSTVNSCNQTIVNNLKQFPLPPTETLKSITAGTSPVKPFMRDLPCHASAAVSVLSKMSAIPEYEYVWQGGFEIHKSAILPQFCDGIQAHLSTWTSPKVLEVVNKFPHKVLLNEVPRLSTWPIQFQERGVKYNNVALYFFARDLESYEKGYKRLLENMMKSDVALKGNFDGVELLIFPSNQLPENSQRWNMLFFLWGVFRVKRVDCSQHVSGSPNNFCPTRDISNVIMSSPEKISSRGPMDKDVSVADQSCNVHESCQAPALGELPSLSAEVNGGHDIKVSSLDPHSQSVEANMGRQDCRLYSTPLSRIQMRSALLSPKERLTSLLLEKSVDLDCEVDAELQPSIQATTETPNGCNESEKMSLSWDNPLGRQHDSPLSLKRLPIGRQEGGAVGSVGVEGKRPSLLHSTNDQVKIEWNLEEEERSFDTKAALERETVKRDKTMKGMDSWQFNGRKHPLSDPPERFLPSSGGTSQPTSWNEVSGMSVAGSASKKQRIDFGGVSYARRSSTGTSSSMDGFASGIHDAGTCSPMIKEEEKWDESCEKRVIPESSLGNAERHFFPVDPPPPLKDFGLGDNPIPWEVFSPKDVRLHDLAPNLELALGAEKKPPSKPGMLPFLVSKVDKKNDQEHYPPENLSTKGGEEDNVSSSLSLSLSFPFPDKEQTAKPVSETEQLLSERRHIKTSLLLFGGFSDK